MVFYAVTKDGVTALHGDPVRLLEEPGRFEDLSLSKAVKEMISKKEGSVSYEFDGQQKSIAFATSPYTGWHFAFGFVTNGKGK